MYKHVAKQRKLIDENKEVTLSDEDSSGNEDSDEGSSAGESNSDAGEGDSDDDDSEDSEDDEEEVAGEEEKAKELELAPPPTGFPTAEEAILAPVANTEKEGTNDVVPVCVICPTKALKPGRMLEVHLGSKDHTRRLKRFTSHVRSETFPPTSLTMDARQISAQLDTIVNTRLILQTTEGGPSIPSKTPTRPKNFIVTKKTLANAPPNPDGTMPTLNELKNKAAKERSSNRATMRAEKIERNLRRKAAKTEKKVRVKEEKEKAAKAIRLALTPEEKEVAKDKANKIKDANTARKAAVALAKAESGNADSKVTWRTAVVVKRTEKKAKKLAAAEAQKAAKAAAPKRSREGKTKEGREKAKELKASRKRGRPSE